VARCAGADWHRLAQALPRDRALADRDLPAALGRVAGGPQIKHYYAPESVGIATGFLIAALHQAGLATLTHTLAPMGFLNAICGRPENEKAMILLVAGKPAEGCLVPAIGKKPIEEVAVFL
jgi:hypothetical protein